MLIQAHYMNKIDHGWERDGESLSPPLNLYLQNKSLIPIQVFDAPR